EDMVVVAGVEGDLVRAARRGQRSHDVERLIPIERGDLDRYDRFQLEEAAPKGVIEPPTAHRRLQVKPDDRDLFRDQAAMLDQTIVIGVPERPEAEQPSIVP